MTLRNAVSGLVLVGLLTACTAGTGPDDPPEPTASDSPSPTADGPEAAETQQVVAATTMTIQGAEVNVDVYPLVRDGDAVVLTLDLTLVDSEDGEDPVSTGLAFSAVAPLGGVQWPGGMRLFDLVRDVVHVPAEDDDGRPVTNLASASSGDWISGEGTRWQVAYAAPGADVDHLGLHLPGAPYVESVPVLDGDVPPPAPEAAASESASADEDPSDSRYQAVDVAQIAQARVLPLESYTRELAGAVSTAQTTEEVQIALGSDVLFATDSDELSDQALAALDAAAAHLVSREPGPVAVVGHTDDVASDAYNQDLSERRAAAVAEALAERIDTSAYPLEPSGRGESEPLVPNTGEENRALNRRVTLTLTTEVQSEQEVTTTGELPDFDGPVGTGAEGVVFGTQEEFTARAPSARSVDGHLVVDLLVSPVTSTDYAPMLSGVWSHRGDSTWTADSAADGVVVLVGSTAVYPMDYQWASNDSGEYMLWLPAAPIHGGSTLLAGQTRAYSLIYPEVGDLDTITIQLPRTLGTSPFRLTDIPVER